MDIENNKVKLFCSQTKEIAENFRNGGTHQAKMKFIREKYGDVANIFMTVYDWYANHTIRGVLKPDGAKSGIWAFADLKLIYRDERCTIMALSVPIDRAFCPRCRFSGRTGRLMRDP